MQIKWFRKKNTDIAFVPFNSTPSIVPSCIVTWSSSQQTMQVKHVTVAFPCHMDKAGWGQKLIRFHQVWPTYLILHCPQQKALLLSYSSVWDLEIGLWEKCYYTYTIFSFDVGFTNIVVPGFVHGTVWCGDKVQSANSASTMIYFDNILAPGRTREKESGIAFFKYQKNVVYCIIDTLLCSDLW